MRLSNHIAIGIALSFTMAVEGVAFADDPVVDTPPLNEMDKETGKAVRPRATKPVVEELKIEAVNLPRRITRRAILPQNPAAVDQEVSRIQQFVQMCRPAVKLELRLIRHACNDLPIDERMKLKGAVDARLESIAKEKKGPIDQLEANGNSELTKIARKAVVGAMKESVSEEFLAKYLKTTSDRAANRKRAAILDLVARLDGELYLTAKQRDRITNSFASEWNVNMEDRMEQFAFTSQTYFPTNIDHYILPYLNEDQVAVWRDVQKADVQTRIDNPLLNDKDDDDWWGLPRE